MALTLARHPRECRNQQGFMALFQMDSRLRGNDNVGRLCLK